MDSKTKIWHSSGLTNTFPRLVGTPIRSLLLECQRERPVSITMSYHHKAKTLNCSEVFSLYPSTTPTPAPHHTGPCYVGSFSGMIANEMASQQIDELWDKVAPIVFEFREVEPEKAIKVAHAIREHYMEGKAIKENPAGFTK
ncbi:unnamed protein product, partial [Nesidiocoris tenuis]